ncbi:MAG: hypothetical protein C0613_12430 [Desulfobulbaceae bacterium]|nr:MAG: hypothetical protein C0613_12430 [Desulfobulbaceae bacterium]
MPENSKKTWSGANDEPASADANHPLGFYLKQEREKRGKTIAEVAAATRIRQDTLEAIETGDQSRLPATAFTKGFIKLYAEHLGLDQAEILERFDKEWGGVQRTVPKFLAVQSMSESSPLILSRPFFLILAIIIVLAVMTYFFFQSDATSIPDPAGARPPAVSRSTDQVSAESRQTPQPVENRETLLVSPQSPGKIPREGLEPPQATEPAPQAMAPQKITTARSSPAPAPRQNADLPPAAAAPLDAQEEAALSIKPSPAKTRLATGAKPAATEPVELHIRFVKRTRISIAQDNRQPERYIFTAGEESSWQAQGEITIQASPADGLQMTLNGSPITLAETDGPLAISLPADLNR